MENFISEGYLLSKIEEFRSLGFDEIRIPGGSSLGEEHYSGVFLFVCDEASKKLFFLGVPYNSSYFKNGSGNSHTKKAGETPAETARRELFEETGLLVEEKDLNLSYSYSVQDRHDKKKLHTKYFFLTKEFQGTLSDFAIRPNPIDNETASPLWIPASLFKDLLYRGHQAAFKKACDFLKLESADLYYALCF